MDTCDEGENGKKKYDTRKQQYFPYFFKDEKSSADI